MKTLLDAMIAMLHRLNGSVPLNDGRGLGTHALARQDFDQAQRVMAG